MTEFWVSQGNKWCDFCKIYISNNPGSIRNHELGQRHKDNVAKKLTTMRKDKLEKEKKEKEAARTLEQIEERAKRSYQKDVASFDEARDSQELSEEWEYDATSGYYYNQRNGFHHDPKSGFYYSDAIGKWVTPEEAYASPHYASTSSQKGPVKKKPKAFEIKGSSKSPDVAAPGVVVSGTLNPARLVKGAPSSLVVGKRKRPHEKVKVISEEEKAALKAREAARKRVEEREAPLLGLYRR